MSEDLLVSGSISRKVQVEQYESVTYSAHLTIPVNPKDSHKTPAVMNLIFTTLENVLEEKEREVRLASNKNTPTLFERMRQVRDKQKQMGFNNTL